MSIRVCIPLVCLALAGCENAPAPGAERSSPRAMTPPQAATASAAIPLSSASAAAEAAPDKIAAQHILVAYKGAKNAPAEVARSKVDARTLAEELQKKASGDAVFADLAKEHSDDPGSAARLGSVGTFTREKMHEKFSEAAFALKVNEISPVVETPFGFHIIKRNQ